MTLRSAVLAIAIACLFAPAAAGADDLPPPPSPTASLLVIHTKVQLKDPLDLRPTPTDVGLVLGPGRAKPVFSDQTVSVFLIDQPGEYYVAHANMLFRTKRQSGIVGNERGLRPDNRFLIQIGDYEVGQMALPVAASTITFAGTMKLRLRRDGDNNSSLWGVTPGIEAGEWIDSEADDEKDFIDDVVGKSAWKDRKLARLGAAR
jgi:hypothetical protein